MDSSTPPPTDAADSIVDAAANSPLKLRIVAHLFIIEGVAGVADQFVHIFWVGGCWINISVLGIFIGRGLLRHRDGWRITGLLLAELALLLIVLMLILLAMSPWLFPSSTMVYGPGGLVGAVSSIVLITAVAVWQVHVLKSRDIVGLFRSAHERKTPDLPWIPRRFSIAMLLYATLLAAVAFASVRSNQSNIEHQRQHDASTSRPLP